jgi:transposase
VVNSRQVREFARAAGRLAKTDRLDAAVIAHFAETFYAAAGLRAGAERRLALLRAERQEIEREAIVDRDPRRRSLPA